MTTAELIELGFAGIDTGLLSISIYITIVSGYLVVAYVAGSNLGQFQLYTISFLFVSFAFLLTLSTFASLRGGMRLFANIDNTDRIDWISRALEVGVLVVAILQIIGIALSLKFMFDERNKGGA